MAFVATQRYRLKLKKLEFLSAVDRGAQGPIANAVLLKRAGEVEATFRVAKTDPSLGLVFGWGFASSLDGGVTPHVDLQDDAIDPDFLKACVDFIEGGAATDVMHDGEQDGRVVFAFPLLPDICKALGIDSKTHGLAVAIKPSPDTFKRFQSGELGAFSIAGLGERSPITKQKKCAACDGYVATDAATCPSCGKSTAKRDVAKAVWSTAMIDDLPDSSFLYVEPGGEKDDSGKTTPRSLRMFPYKDASGAIDLDHLRNAISRIPDSSLPAALRNKLQVKAEKLLGEQHQKRAVADDESDRDDAAVIAARDESTREPPIVKVNPVPKEHAQMPKTEAEIIALEKRAERAEKLATLTTGQRAHFDALADTDRDSFLAKSHKDRNADIQAAIDADEVIYKTTSGQEIRKSDGPRAAEFAKRADENEKAMKEGLGEIAKAREAAQTATLAKRAGAEIGFLKGTEADKVALLRAIDGIADEETKKRVTEMVKGASEITKSYTTFTGVHVGPDGAAVQTALQKFDAGVKEFSKGKTGKTPEQLTVDFLRTPEGAELYADTQTAPTA